MSQKMEISCISDLMSKDIIYIGMFMASKRGARNVAIYDDIKIISDDVEGTLYIACEELEEFKNNKIKIDYKDYYYVSTYNKEISDYIKDKYRYFDDLGSYYMSYYHKKDKFDLEYDDFRILDISYFDIIRSRYKRLSDEEIKERLNSSKVFGLFIDNELVGFIGIHKEGDMGIFAILEEYEDQGYEYHLEANLINYMLENDLDIYMQIKSDDKKLLELQEKLGLKTSQNLQYWLYANEKY